MKHLAIAFALIVPSICNRANAAEHHACAVVPKTGASLAGEGMSCNQCGYSGGVAGFNGHYGCVKCNSVSVTVPADEDATSWDRTVDTGGWWAWLDNVTSVENADGSTTFTTGLKNWSDNRDRTFCLSVKTE